VLEELQLHGYRPGDDEPDPRSLPEIEALHAAIGGLFDTLAEPLMDTRLGKPAHAV
jgi:hypothetical protein